MKKKILSQLFILSFAFAGLFLVGNNMFASNCTSGGPGSSSCDESWTIKALGFTFSGGCSVSCDSGYYACCNGGSSTCTCQPAGDQEV